MHFLTYGLRSILKRLRYTYIRHSRRRQNSLGEGKQKFARIFFHSPKYHRFNF